MRAGQTGASQVAGRGVARERQGLPIALTLRRRVDPHLSP